MGLKQFAKDEELLQLRRQPSNDFAQLPHAFNITDGLFRVDFFQTITGKMVVNELESLDAEYQSTTAGTNEAT